MISNLDRFKKDLDSLMKDGDQLAMSLQRYAFDDFEEMVKKQLGDKADKYLKDLPILGRVSGLVFRGKKLNQATFA